MSRKNHYGSTALLRKERISIIPFRQHGIIAVGGMVLTVALILLYVLLSGNPDNIKDLSVYGTEKQVPVV